MVPNKEQKGTLLIKFTFMRAPVHNHFPYTEWTTGMPISRETKFTCLYYLRQPDAKQFTLLPPTPGGQRCITEGQPVGRV